MDASSCKPLRRSFPSYLQRTVNRSFRRSPRMLVQNEFWICAMYVDFPNYTCYVEGCAKFKGLLNTYLLWYYFLGPWLVINHAKSVNVRSMHKVNTFSLFRECLTCKRSNDRRRYAACLVACEVQTLQIYSRSCRAVW